MRAWGLLALSFFFFGCQKTIRIVEQIPGKSFPFGTYYRFQPIAQSPLAGAGQDAALAHISYIDGPMGTGFFISSDGLLLTNHHVVPRSRCSAERCGGIRIIRQFAPGGAFEVYSSAKVIAHNEQLDYALLKVEVPQPVPHFTLGRTTSLLPGESLYFMGHPAGASLQLAAGSFLSKNKFQLLIKAASMQGFSGSPVIRQSNGQLVGILNAIHPDLSSTKMNTGEIKFYSAAIGINAILRSLESVFPKLSNAQSLDISVFDETVGETTNPLLKTILPRPQSDFLEAPSLSFEAFISQYLGTDREKAGLNKLFSSVTNGPASEEKTLELVHQLIALDTLRAGSFSKDHLEEIGLNFALDLLGVSGVSAKNSYQIVYEASGREACLQRASENPLILFELQMATFECQAPFLSDGSDVLDRLFEAAPTYGNQPVFFNFAYRLIRQQAQLRVLSANDLQVARSAALLRQGFKHTDSAYHAYTYEGLAAMLEQNPDLVGPASFEDTIKE